MNLDEYGKVIYDCDLYEYNTYKVKSTCKALVFPSDLDNLIKLLKYLKDNKIPYKVLGHGSNVIFANKYIDKVLIKLDNLSSYSISDDILTIESGAYMPKAVNYCIENEYSGLEWAYSIPGTVGGNIFNNAGAYNSQIFDNIIDVTVLDEHASVVTLKKEDLTYGYRTSFFKENNKYIIVGARFSLQKGNKEQMRQYVLDNMNKRKEGTPLEYPNAGSVFRNPEGLYAGKLIEDAGLKGYSINDALVSEKHANFIINKGKCTGEDIVKLISYIQDKVKKEFNVELILEQEIIY